MPTAFVATYGSGRPVIASWVNTTALPGFRRKASPVQEALQAGAAGHGCGHNMFGPASLGAAIAIKEQIAAGKLKGTVRFLWHACRGGRRRQGLHGPRGPLRRRRRGARVAPERRDAGRHGIEPGDGQPDRRVRGRTAHAAGDPWNGRSAVDAAELFTHGINMMREHIKPTSACTT